MATLVITDAYIVVNGVNLSDHCKSVAFSFNANMLDDTVMGYTVKSNHPGLFEWSLDIELLNDYAAGSIDATMFALVGAVAFPIEVRPTSAAVGVNNPKFTANGVLATYDPVNAKIGELATAKCSIKCAGGNLVRSVA